MATVFGLRVRFLVARVLVVILVMVMMVLEKPACRIANARTAVGARNLESSRGRFPGENKEQAGRKIEN